MKTELLKLLNEYYGNKKDDKEKEEIAEFIEKNAEKIFRILN